GYTNMFIDMFNAIEQRKQPNETFYDGYVVNAIIDAAYKSAKTKQWEPVKLDIWRGQTGLTKGSHLVSYDEDHYLIKEEMTHFGTKKLILKNKQTGKISEQII
ncbi:MAG TPA: oxidoreductase, partial [Chitinophagaceae bacterium]|nr:oxidoreductase [Chitinophagaceae bacterium]